MILVCHVISEDPLTKVWSNIMGGISSWQVISLTSLATIGTVMEEIY